MLNINNETYKFKIKLILRMCVVFYSSFVCISAYANVYFKTILRECLRTGLPPGFPSTAPPPVRVSAVLGTHASCVDSNPNQKKLTGSSNSNKQTNKQTNIRNPRKKERPTRTACSREDETRNGYRNAKRNPRWSSQVSFQMAPLKRDLIFDHRGFRFAFRRAFRVSSSRERGVVIIIISIPQITPNMQIHPLQNNIRVSKVHCGSAFEPGASGLPYYCTSICACSCGTWRASSVDSKL